MRSSESAILLTRYTRQRSAEKELSRPHDEAREAQTVFVLLTTRWMTVGQRISPDWLHSCGQHLASVERKDSRRNCPQCVPVNSLNLVNSFELITKLVHFSRYSEQALMDQTFGVVPTSPSTMPFSVSPNFLYRSILPQFHSSTAFTLCT